MDNTTLEKTILSLFGSGAKVRVLKLLLNNPDQRFDLGEISRRTKVGKPQVKRHIDSFVKIGLIRAVLNAKKEEKTNSN